MSKRLAIPVTASAGEEVRVQVALVSPDTAAPAVGSRLWQIVAIVPVGALPTTVHTQPFPTPTRAWVRAAGWQDGARVTNYTDPVSVDLEAEPLLEAVTLTVDEGGGLVQWVPGGITEEVRIRWAVGPGDGEELALGAPVDVPAKPGAFAIPARPAMRDRVTVELQPLSDGGATAGQAWIRSEVRPEDFGTVLAPRHWLFFNDASPVRANDFSIVLESGLAIPDGWLLANDGTPLRLNDLTIVRSGT
jgi:hypothetical protein